MGRAHFSPVKDDKWNAKRAKDAKIFCVLGDSAFIFALYCRAKRSNPMISARSIH
jgi:hypothetical protein